MATRGPPKKTNQPYNIAWIRSDDCEWPSTVKQQAILVIKTRAELFSVHNKFVVADMMTEEKVTHGEKLAGLQQQLALHYRNLSREIAFHLGVVKSHHGDGDANRNLQEEKDGKKGRVETKAWPRL